MELSLKGGYSQFWKAIIRPPRDTYTLKDLGPKAFLMHGTKCQRTDVQLRNDRGFTLQCSFFEPHESIRPMKELPCVIYLHGNCSSRRGAFDTIEALLPQYISVFTFDFAGCGLSEGEYISLGYHEKNDLECVVRYLRDSGKVSLIGLWGRSMGAATALLHGHRDPSIAGMVLDSPFAHLKQLASELVSNNTKIPGFVVSIAMKMVRSSIQSKANFDIFDLNPIEHVETCFIPAFFVAGTFDDFVKSHHTEQIYEKYAGDKQIELFEGDHNGSRPEEVIFKITQFFYQTLQCDQIQLAISEQKAKKLQNAGHAKGNKEVFSVLDNRNPIKERSQSDGESQDEDNEERVKFYKGGYLDYQLDEEEQLRLAIEASMEESKQQNQNNNS